MAECYTVHITRYAFKQMKEIRQYIEEELSAPEAAKKLMLAMKASIGKLETMPARHQLSQMNKI